MRTQLLIVGMILCMVSWLPQAVAQQTLTNVFNVGAPSAAPGLAFAGETYTFSAAGANIAGTSDQFGFAWESIHGDTEIVARVEALQNTGSNAKSGVMIRESLAPDAAHVAIVLSPGSGARFIYRTNTGGSTTTLTTSGIAAPQWVRLVRDDNYFTGYASPDGVRWRMIGTVTAPLATNVLTGIAVCSGASGTLCQSQLARVDFLDAVRRPGVTVYNWPSGIPQSDKYQVKIIQNGITNVSFVHVTRPEDRQNLGTQGDKTIWYTHGGRTFSWANFACWGPVTIEVKKLFGSAATLANITLSPKSYSLTPQLVDGHTVRFQMDTPRYVSVKFDVAENRVSNRPAEIKHGLMLFADPPELSAPRTNDPGVVEWDPNVNQTAAKVLYLLSGRTYMGPGATNANGTFSTNSTGGNFHLAANQSLYLAGGAYAWFSDWGPSPNANTFIGGRGIISGVKQVFGFWTPGGCCWQAFETQDGYEGVTFVDVPHHALGFSANAVVRRIKIASWHTNQDGLRGGQNTLAENNFLKCNDDYYYSGLHVRRTVIWPMWNGSTTQLGWGGYNNSNTRMYDCDLINPEWDHLNKNQGFFGGAALWWSDRGENHLFENIRIEGAINALVNINMTTEASGTTPGYLRNVTFRNVTMEKRQFLSKDNAYSRSRLHGVLKSGVPCLLTNWLFENVKIEGEWLTASNAAVHLDIDPATTANIQFLVTATAQPSIITHPVSQTVIAGGTTAFGVMASGTAPLHYQWWFNQTNALPGATNDSLAISPVEHSDAGDYRVVVTNSLGAVTSAIAALTVTDNLLLNPGFESGITGWSEYNGGNCDIAHTTADTHTGSGAVRVFNRANRWTGVQQSLTDFLLANGPGYYAYSAWGKTESGVLDAYVTLRMVDQSPGTRWFAAPAIPIDSTTWKQSSTTNFLNWTNLAQAYVYFETSSTALDSFLVDDFNLEYRGATPSGEPAILSLENHGNGVITLSWPASMTLERTTSLTPPIIWTPETAGVTQTNEVKSHTTSAGEPLKFYRTRL